MELQPAFVRSFVETCYDAGVSVRATSDMLDAHIARDRCRNPEFQKGASEVLDVRVLTDYVAGDDFWADTPPVPVMEKRSGFKDLAKLVGAGTVGGIGGLTVGAAVGGAQGYNLGREGGADVGERLMAARQDSMAGNLEGGYTNSDRNGRKEDRDSQLVRLARILQDYAGSDLGQAQLTHGGGGAALGGLLGAVTGDEDSSKLKRSLIGSLLGGAAGAGVGTLADKYDAGYLNK